MPIYDNCHRVLHSFRNVHLPREYTYLYIVEREGKKEGGGRQRGGRGERYIDRGEGREGREMEREEWRGEDLTTC